MIDIWDNPEAVTADPDELAPTLRIVPMPSLATEERIAMDARSLNTQLRYEEAA